VTSPGVKGMMGRDNCLALQKISHWRSAAFQTLCQVHGVLKVDSNHDRSVVGQEASIVISQCRQTSHGQVEGAVCVVGRTLDCGSSFL
jgi:hypothetical protein